MISIIISQFVPVVFAGVDDDNTIVVQKQDDPIQVLFANTMLVLGFIAALGTAVGIVSALVLWIRRVVTKTTNDFIDKQTSDLKQNKIDTKEKLDNVQSNLCNQITSVNNNVNEKFGDLKRVIDNIDDKFDKSKEFSIRHDQLLNEHERRINSLENRFGNFSSGPNNSRV